MLCCSTSSFAACIRSSRAWSVWYERLTFEEFAAAGMKAQQMSIVERRDQGLASQSTKRLARLQTTWLIRVLPRCHSNSATQTLTFSVSPCDIPSMRGIHEILVVCLKKSTKLFALMAILSLNYEWKQNFICFKYRQGGRLHSSLLSLVGN